MILEGAILSQFPRSIFFLCVFFFSSIFFLSLILFLLIKILFRFNILSKYTAFVAVDKNNKHVGGSMQIKKEKKENTEKRYTYRSKAKWKCMAVPEEFMRWAENRTETNNKIEKEDVLQKKNQANSLFVFPLYILHHRLPALSIPLFPSFYSIFFLSYLFNHAFATG